MDEQGVVVGLGRGHGLARELERHTSQGMEIGKEDARGRGQNQPLIGGLHRAVSVASCQTHAAEGERDILRELLRAVRVRAWDRERAFEINGGLVEPSIVELLVGAGSGRRDGTGVSGSPIG